MSAHLPLPRVCFGEVVAPSATAVPPARTAATATVRAKRRLRIRPITRILRTGLNAGSGADKEAEVRRRVADRLGRDPRLVHDHATARGSGTSSESEPRTLVGALWPGTVAAHDPPPGHIRGHLRERTTGVAGGAGRQVSISRDEAFGDAADAGVDGLVGKGHAVRIIGGSADRCRSGRVPLVSSPTRDNGPPNGPRPQERHDQYRTEGIKIVLHPVSDLEAAKPVYAALLGTEPQADSPYYVGFDVEGQHIGLVPGSDMDLAGRVLARARHRGEARRGDSVRRQRQGSAARGRRRPRRGDAHRSRRKRPGAGPGQVIGS